MKPDATPAAALTRRLLPPVLPPYRWFIEEVPFGGPWFAVTVKLKAGRKVQGWARLNPDGRKYTSPAHCTCDGDDTLHWIAARVRKTCDHVAAGLICGHPQYHHTVEVMVADLTEQARTARALTMAP